MLILAIETSGKNGGVALARGDGHAFDLLSEAPIGAGQYSAELMPRIVELLDSTGISKNQIDGFAVASGPGSFTGLRVGIATVKALADTLHKPLAAVSVLEAIAQNARDAQQKLAANDPEARERKLQRERIVALLDAGRDEVYLGIFEFETPETQLKTVREVLWPFDDLQENLAQLASEPLTIATSDEKLRERLLEQDVSVLMVPRPGAGDIARLGIEKLVHGEAATVAELDANYIRRSDAEIFSLPKLRS